MIDPSPLLKQLIGCRSVTPAEGGALGFIEGVLAAQGFQVERLRFSEAGTADVENLFARHGSGHPHFCFAGHTDVVPPGHESSWSHPPFGGEEINGVIYGRGASDMKGSVAAFMAAAGDFIDARKTAFTGSISLLLTGDEEGPAVNGTAKVLSWLKERNSLPDDCLVGEPTCTERLGDTIKIGRRGSVNVTVTVSGRQGHSAYPQLADNPIPKLVRLLDRLASHKLDKGSEPFDPSHLAITSVDVGNPASNIIPARAGARFNIRFNPLHSSASLRQWIETEALRVKADMGGEFEIAFSETADAFLTKPGPFVEVVRKAVETVTGIKPVLSASGGTSDARFIKTFCPVVEFGPRNATVHQVDERIEVEELRVLKDIYRAVLDRYFGPA
jgi:succinyl-diaminopimelate desuccinylase